MLYYTPTRHCEIARSEQRDNPRIIKQIATINKYPLIGIFVNFAITEVRVALRCRTDSTHWFDLS